MTPDSPFPSTAVFVQKKLGAQAGGGAFDLSAACAGFIYGWRWATTSSGGGMFKRVLVIGVEVLSRIIDWQDRTTCVLFGDGAGAVLLGPERSQAGRAVDPPVLRRNQHRDPAASRRAASREP